MADSYSLTHQDMLRLRRLLNAYESGELTPIGGPRPGAIPPRPIVEFGAFDNGIAGSTSLTLPAGTVTLHTFSTTAGTTEGLTAATTEQVEVYNVSPYSASATDRVLLERHHRTGQWLSQVIPSPPVQFGEPDADITAATSANSTGGTFSIFKLNADAVVDTGNNITLTNLTNGALPSDEQTMAWFHHASQAWITARPKIVEFGRPATNIAGLSTGGNASSGTITVHTLSSTGGITSASTTLTAWNLQHAAISATSTGTNPLLLLHRHHRTGRWLIDPPPHVVEIGKADSDINGATTGGTAGSGTVSIYTLTTANVLTDTNINVTALNLSIDSVTAGKTLQLKRHYRTGKWLIDFEDCGST